MNVSRSGYYKWLSRKGKINNYKKNRLALAEEIKNIHKHHSTYGYRSIAQNIRNKTGWIFSNNLCHKVCKSLNIRSKARKTYIPRGEESITYPNIVNGNFNPSRPFEVVVSDTTIIHCRGKSYDWTYYIDVYNNEIISSDIQLSKHGNGINNHFNACKQFLEEKIKRGYKDLETIFHTDQGTIYSSKAFNKLHDNYTIKRSMSRAGTPTDNPVIEALNGWIKNELYKDFNIHVIEAKRNINSNGKKRGKVEEVIITNYENKETFEDIKNNISKRDELQRQAGFYEYAEMTIEVDVTDCKTVEESSKKVLKYIM